MKSPTGYDLNNPVEIDLSKKVDEISGIVFNQSDSTLFAIDDNEGNLYKISLTNDPQIQKWKIGKSEDFEDIVMTDTSFFVLVSKGNLLQFPRSIPPRDVSEFNLGLKGFNEFETLYYESQHNRLILFCKECKEDDDNTVSAYAYDLTGQRFIDTPVLRLRKKEVEKVAGEKLSRIKASAGSINPLTGEVFIISSINKILIVLDPDFNVKETYDLKRSKFVQPEGICFSPSGTLFISNEAGTEGKANILIFKRDQ